jgi:HK97 family phage prohead protease
METLRDLDVVRAVHLAPNATLREDSTGGDAALADDVLGTLHGHFSVFDSWYRIDSWWEGTFLETVDPGAYRKTFSERWTKPGSGTRSGIVTAFDHGFDPQIGDKVLGPIDDLREDGTGAYYEIGLLDTSYNRDLLPGLKRGLYGASFRFQVIKDEWNDEPGKSDDNPDGIPERRIKEARVFEFGPVTYPASPAATAGMRSMTDSYYDRLRDRDPVKVDALRSRVHQLRTSAGSLPAEAAPHSTTEPAARHSGGLSHAARRVALYPYLKG